LKTSILYSITFSLIGNRVVYQIMWENNVERDKPQMSIWHMRIACWTPIANRTHSEHVVFIAFRHLQWLHKCASTLRNTCNACLVVSYR